jgi:hypothetical protein
MSTPMAGPAPGTRSSEEIRADIVRQREELSQSVDQLRSRWSEVTDVGYQVRKHQSQLIAGAVVIGALVGAAVLFGRRRA